MSADCDNRPRCRFKQHTPLLIALIGDFKLLWDSLLPPWKLRLNRVTGLLLELKKKLLEFSNCEWRRERIEASNCCSKCQESLSESELWAHYVWDLRLFNLDGGSYNKFQCKWTEFHFHKWNQSCTELRITFTLCIIAYLRLMWCILFPYFLYGLWQALHLYRWHPLRLIVTFES